jgi:dienelactone hydrolase
MIIGLATPGLSLDGTPTRLPVKVSFPSGEAKETPIAGYLYKPTGPGPFAAVVGMPGCDGLLDKKGEINPLYGQWGEILSGKGYVVLLFDSFQPRGQGSQCLVQPVGARTILPWMESVFDALDAGVYLRSRFDVRPDSIAMLGQSYGAMAMMFTISNIIPVPCEKDFRAAVSIYPNCVPIPHQDAHWRPRIPMLLLMGELDPSFLACKDLIARAMDAPIDMHFYADTFHGFDHPNLPRTVTDVRLPPDGRQLIIGSNPEARADAINRVTQFLAKQLP